MLSDPSGHDSRDRGYHYPDFIRIQPNAVYHKISFNIKPWDPRFLFLSPWY